METVLWSNFALQIQPLLKSSKRKAFVERNNVESSSLSATQQTSGIRDFGQKSSKLNTEHAYKKGMWQKMYFPPQPVKLVVVDRGNCTKHWVIRSLITKAQNIGLHISRKTWDMQQCSEHNLDYMTMDERRNS